MHAFKSDQPRARALVHTWRHTAVLRMALVWLAMVAMAMAGGMRDAAASGPQSSAGPRLALVIGNDDYREFPKLIGAVSDADLVAGALTARGFQVVKATNVGRAAMTALIADFEQSLALRGGVGVFYFSGQAMNMAGEDILFPIDARQASGASLAKEGISLAQVQREIRPRTERPWRDNGIVTLYATSKGQVAFDSLPGQKNSPFAIAFVNALKQPGDDVQEVFQRVRQGVEDAFRDPKLKDFKQTPDISGQLRERVFFSQPARDPAGSLSRILLLDASRDTVSTGTVTR